MRKCKKKENFEKSRENFQISLTKKRINFPDKYLLKEIEISKKEALKTSIPLNYIKVNETLTTTVYKIPMENSIFRNKSPKEKKIFHKKFFLNNNNNDKLYNKQKNNYFPNKPFSSRELGYKYYNQKLNPISPPHEIKSKNFFYLKKSKSPPILHTSLKTTNINSIDNKEGFNRYKSPLNLKRNKSLNNLLYPRFLYEIIQNKNHLHSNRIRHRIINLNRTNDFINNKFNKFNLHKEYNYNESNKTINNNNYLHNRKRICLNDNNYSFSNINNFKNSVKNLYISSSPRARLPRNMSFIYDRNIDSPHRYEKYDYFNGGKILNTLEKNKSKDGKYEIETSLSKIIYDKHGGNKENEEIKIIENEQENHSRKYSSKKYLGDNYKYYERKDTKTPIKSEKINHIRRTPAHVYGFENYIMKNNKKIYLKTPTIKGKLIRLYRNNDNKNCRMCAINEVKRKKFEPIWKVKENNILLPAKFKKGKFDYYYIK